MDFSVKSTLFLNILDSVPATPAKSEVTACAFRHHVVFCLRACRAVRLEVERSMRVKSLLFAACFTAVLLLCSLPAQAQERGLQGRVVYASARDVRDKDAAEALVKDCRKAGFNVLVLMVKEPDGRLYFTSEKGIQSRADGVAKFDPLAAVVAAAEKEKLTVHAGLCAFLEDPKSPAAMIHPEWAATNHENKNTAADPKSPGLWMCPARKDGYAYAYLIPVIEDLLRNYAVQGIHLTHLSFPVGVSPDSYCFCSYCLDDMPRRSRLFYPAAGRRFDPAPTVSDPLVDWADGSTSLPEGYENSSSKAKVEYLLKGTYRKGGTSDMDYFFYTYRTAVIRDFIAETYERMRAVSPKVEFSAKVHWNAPAAGRFAGQRWTDFGQWFDFLVLDTGRSYLPGDFDTYRKLLADVAFYAAVSSKNLVHVYMCLDVAGIYREEREALDSIVQVLADLVRYPGKDVKLAVTKLAGYFGVIEPSLAAADKTLASELGEAVTTLDKLAAQTQDRKELYNSIGARFQAIASRPPAGFYRLEKLSGALGDALNAGAESVAVDSAGAFSEHNLWKKLPDVLGPPAAEPYKTRPLRAPSVQLVRLFTEKQDQLAKAGADIWQLRERLTELQAQLDPLLKSFSVYELEQKEKQDKLDSLVQELDTLKQEYIRKIDELRKLGAGEAILQPAGQSSDTELPASDTDYAKLQRRLATTIEKLEIATGQRDRASAYAKKLAVQLESALADLTEQKQAYLYYISILIAIACIGLAIALVVSLMRQKR